MPLFPKDDFTLWLEAQGTQPALYQPAARYGGAPVGWKIFIGQSSFVYRLPEDKPECCLLSSSSDWATARGCAARLPILSASSPP
ncbi:hypothetical protein [Verrucomicrobium spinosum]|uniref:hypothetical protein n=1 Tax=Verrucomicrobium spinosum TaxID=2736 RepID=UPI001C43FAB8|nr:hypothetical protein [Verrucomicrobium spinosum]